MKRFIIFVILGGIAAVILNYLDFIKLPEPSFVIGMCFGGIVSIFWPLILSILNLIYALFLLCFATLWLLIKIALLLIAYPFVFIAVSIIGLVCIVFVPGAKIEMPTAFSSLNFTKMQPKSKRIDESDVQDDGE